MQDNLKYIETVLQGFESIKLAQPYINEMFVYLNDLHILNREDPKDIIPQCKQLYVQKRRTRGRWKSFLQVLKPFTVIFLSRIRIRK